MSNSDSPLGFHESSSFFPFFPSYYFTTISPRDSYNIYHDITIAIIRKRIYKIYFFAKHFLTPANDSPSSEKLGYYAMCSLLYHC